MACDPRVKNVFPVTWLHDFSQSWHGLQESFDTPTQENTCGVPDNSNDETRANSQCTAFASPNPAAIFMIFSSSDFAFWFRHSFEIMFLEDTAYH